jgi:hypothetical protein
MSEFEKAAAFSNRSPVGDMNIYIDESIHDQQGFMLLAYVTCRRDPQADLNNILKKYGIEEFHACKKMQNNQMMQKLRSNIRSYVNSYCGWGVLVLPNTLRSNIKDDFSNLVAGLSKFILDESLKIYVDEGIIHNSEADEIVNGIQIADLVAALCGVRLREEITGNSKMLTYGDESGFNPPIEAEIGYELWASLRYSMLRHSEPKGADMPDMASFETEGYGLFVSPHCSDELSRKARKLFGEAYLGCIH